LDKNGCHFGKKANIKEMVDTVVDTYLGIILTKLQIFTMTTHRSFTIFVKCQKITKNCENANFCENFIFFHPICMDMYVFDGKSRKLIEIHILGENYTTKWNIWVIMTKKLPFLGLFWPKNGHFGHL